MNPATSLAPAKRPTLSRVLPFPAYKPLPLEVVRLLVRYEDAMRAAPVPCKAKAWLRRQEAAEDVFLALSDLDPDLALVAITHATKNAVPGDSLPNTRQIADSAIAVFIRGES